MMESAMPAAPASHDLTGGLGARNETANSSTIRMGNKQIKHYNSNTYKKSIEID
jgi:hypothetical protein